MQHNESVLHFHLLAALITNVNLQALQANWSIIFDNSMWIFIYDDSVYNSSIDRLIFKMIDWKRVLAIALTKQSLVSSGGVAQC